VNGLASRNVARRFGYAPTALVLAAACSTPLDTFSNASDAAERVSRLAWFMILVSGIIFVGVVLVMIVAIIRNRGRDAGSVQLDERGERWLLWGGTVMPVVVLASVSVWAVRVLRSESRGPTATTILVTGHQWWWQLDYSIGATDGGQRFRSANELHIPVGRPVRLLLTTADVIHSFWVPTLQGKMDLLPGDTNVLRIEARRPGTYGGACAEYCGLQHAHMAISVVADDSAAFAEWAARQTADAEAPVDSTARAGQRLFVTGACASCHTIRGTTARGEVGPDLTHVGGRRTIAAGTLTNSLGSLEGWIANPQALKPGAAMPVLATHSGPELRALAAYVASLK
jgi:cytochrome c oxidase subunit 2